jgi:flagellar hook-associated protein 2
MSTTITSMTANITAAQQLSSGGSTGVSDLAASASKSLVAQNPGLKLLDAQITRDSAKLSSIGKVALALDDFKSLAGALSAGGLSLAASATGTAVTAKLAGSTAGAANAASTLATAGTHTVDVRQLAQGQKLSSKALPDKTAALGTGTATLIKIATGTGSGATSTTVRVEAPDNTLDGIAKAMKDAGIDATVVPSGKGYALNLTGKTGAANAMHISVSGDAALKGLLTYQPGSTATSGASAMTQTAAAQDAQATVDGKAVSSATNTLAAAIPGVTLTLAATGKSDVKVAGDASAVASNVKSFVTAFNTLSTTLGGLKTANSDTASTVSAVLMQLGTALNGVDKTTLAQMGITRKNNSLVLDEKKLDAAIAADPGAVAKTFSNSGKGLADMLGTQVAQQMATGGLLAKQSATVQQDMSKLTAQQTKLSDTINRQTSALVQQYAAGGTGGSSMFGMLSGSSSGGPMSLFDFLA